MLVTSEVNCFVIVIKDNEASEYYYEYMKKSWEDNGFILNRFDAYHPGNYNDDYQLKFGPSHSQKYSAKKVIKHFTPSERAAFISHYALWRKIYTEQINDVLIIEHDAMLKDMKLFKSEWESAKGIYDVKLFGQGASCYTITPRACRAIKNYIGSNEINLGPMGYLADMSHRVMRYKFDRSFERLGGEKNLPVSHIYNKSIGNTIDKYSNLPKQMQVIYDKQTERAMNERWQVIGE